MLQSMREKQIIKEIPSLEKVWKATPAVIGCCVALWTARAVWRRYALEQKLGKKREQCKSAKRKILQQLYEYPLQLKEREYILGLSLAELQHKLQTGDLSAMDVLRAYQSKALEVDEKTNCVAEPIMEAEDIARACDTQTGIKGPLHGVPFSVKENISIKGYDCTGGMESFINKPAEEDAVVVQVLRKQGAVPFMRTNVPQTMYSYCCSNPLYGGTSHPQHLDRSPGGSSGGEGSILGGGGSIMGLGTDIGGSVRVPAQMCGVCSLKPTRGRLSPKGHFTVNDGQTLVEGTVGIMGTDTEGVIRVAESLFVPELFALDPSVVPVPFRKEMLESTQPLKVGFYTWDGWIRPVPATIRAVHCAKTALEKMGHKVVSFSPPRLKVGFQLFSRVMLGDRNQTVGEKIKRDHIDVSILGLYILTCLPKWVLGLLARLLMRKDPVLANVFLSCKGISSVKRWFKLGKEMKKYKEEFERYWRSQGLDAVICPVFPCPALLTKDALQLTPGGSYCSIYNMLRYSAGSVPVTKVTEADIQEVMDSNVYPAPTVLEKVVQKSSAGSEGLSVSVQCVCQPYHEEQVLRLMRDVEKGLQL